MDMGAVERIHKSAIPPGAQILTGRFVYTIKKKPVEKESDWAGAHVDWDRKLDARLCIRGFLEDLDKSASAPTVCINTIRSILSLVPVLGWDFRVLDISRAYLQSNDLFRTVYMKPPAQTEEDGVYWLVKKPVYGLCDATKGWYDALKEFLVEKLGARVSEADPAMFYWSGHEKKNFYKERKTCKSWEDLKHSSLPDEVDNHIESAKVWGVVTTHVDDLQMFGDQEFLKWITKEILNRFKCKGYEENKATYLGMLVEKHENGSISIDAQNYEDCIDIVHISPERHQDNNAILNPIEEAEFRSALGRIMWLVRFT